MSERRSRQGASACPHVLPTAALLVLLGPGRAIAAEPGPGALPIHVVTIDTEDAEAQAFPLTKALRSAVRGAPGWSLGEPPADAKLGTLRGLTGSLGCAEPPDAACQSRIADTLKSDRYIWGILNKKGDTVAVELDYWVRGQGTKKISLDYSANLTDPEDDALKKVARDALYKLTGGAPKEKTAATAGAPTPVPADSGHPIDVRKVGGFIGIGVGAVFLGLGVVSSLQVNDANNALGTGDKNPGLRADVKSGDICDGHYESYSQMGQATTPAGAREQCSKIAFFNPLQFVFYGLGAVSAGVGVYLLATSGSPAKTTTKAPTTAQSAGFSFSPVLGPRLGGFVATYRF